MKETCEGTFALLRKQERKVGEKRMIKRLLKNNSFEEVSNLLQIDQTELANILK